MARLRGLVARELSTASELEEAENLLALNRIRLGRARARLTAIRTGAKEQELDWRRARIGAARAELAVLDRRLADSAIVSPLTGRIALAQTPDVLAVVHDTSSTVIALIARWSDRQAVLDAERVEIHPGESGETVAGRVAHVGSAPLTQNGRQYFEIRAVVSDLSARIAPGLLVRSSIECGEVRLSEYVVRVLLR